MNDIKTTKCPSCGCTDVKSELKENQHVNGHWNEHREFKCGFKIHFVPNFMSEREEDPCEKGPLYKKAMDRRYAAINKLEKYIARLDVDDNFKERLEHEYKYLSPEYVHLDLKKTYPEEFV